MIQLYSQLWLCKKFVYTELELKMSTPQMLSWKSSISCLISVWLKNRWMRPNRKSWSRWTRKWNENRVSTSKTSSDRTSELRNNSVLTLTKILKFATRTRTKQMKKLIPQKSRRIILRHERRRPSCRWFQHGFSALDTRIGRHPVIKGCCCCCCCRRWHC